MLKDPDNARNQQDGGKLVIGKVARSAGVTADTIRFYEREGLLPRPDRTAAGYRIYDESALHQVRFIKQAQSLGFSLQEIRRILSLRQHGKMPCACVMDIAEATLGETERKLSELAHFCDGLKSTLRRWRKASRNGAAMAAEFCALIESTEQTKAGLKRPAMLERQEKAR